MISFVKAKTEQVMTSTVSDFEFIKGCLGSMICHYLIAMALNLIIVFHRFSSCSLSCLSCPSLPSFIHRETPERRAAHPLAKRALHKGLTAGRT